MRKEYWFGVFNGRGFRGGAETRDCIVSTRVCSDVADGSVTAVCMTAMSERWRCAVGEEGAIVF